MPFFVVPGRARQDRENREVHDLQIGSDFFATLEMPLLQGRGLAERDMTSRPVPIVINETLARQFFDGTNRIGQRVGLSKDIEGTTVPATALMKIVGVARDARYTTVRQTTPPALFRPYDPGAVTFEVRTAGDPLAAIAAIREAVRQVDATLVLNGFRTQIEIAELTFARERHFAVLSSLFGVLALVLACIGLAGVKAYNVSNRTREIGVRMALGAARWKVIQLVTSDTLVTVAVGVALGLAGAAGLTQLISSMLFGLAPNDTPTIAVAIVLMLAVAVLAAFSRRGARHG